MAEKMNCQTAQELIPASLLDALEVDEELAVLTHLRECASCRAEADALRPVVDSLGLAVADAGRPSAYAKTQVMSKLRSVPKPQAAFRPQRRPIFRPIAALIPAAIALVLIFGLGAAVISLQAQVTQQQARLDRFTQQQVALRQFMIDANMQPVVVKMDELGKSAEAALYASSDRVALAITGLPSLAGESVYQCWWINSKTGEVTPGTTFKVDANGAGIWVWNIPEGGGYTKMVITQENGPGNPQAQGPKVLTAEF